MGPLSDQRPEQQRLSLRNSTLSTNYKTTTSKENNNANFGFHLFQALYFIQASTELPTNETITFLLNKHSYNISYNDKNTNFDIKLIYIFVIKSFSLKYFNRNRFYFQNSKFKGMSHVRRMNGKSLTTF